MVSSERNSPEFKLSAASTPSVSNIRAPWAVIVLGTVCLLWAGMILGISVLETPVKFQAPTLTRAVGMDVGRTVFSAFNKVEIVWSIITFGLLIFARPFHHAPRFLKVLLPLIWLIIAVQSVFLLPQLVERALMIMNNQTPPPSPLHLMYSSTELVKLLSLIACGVLLMRSLLPASRAR